MIEPVKQCDALVVVRLICMYQCNFSNSSWMIIQKKKKKTKLGSKSRSPHLDEGAIKLKDKPRLQSTMDKFNVRVSVMKDISAKSPGSLLSLVFLAISAYYMTVDVSWVSWTASGWKGRPFDVEDEVVSMYKIIRVYLINKWITSFP